MSWISNSAHFPIFPMVGHSFRNLRKSRKHPSRLPKILASQESEPENVDEESKERELKGPASDNNLDASLKLT